MRLSYKVNSDIKIAESRKVLKFPLGDIEYRQAKGQTAKWLHLGSMSVQKSAQLSEAEVLAILAEVVSRTSARIKVEFEEGVVLEFE